MITDLLREELSRRMNSTVSQPKVNGQFMTNYTNALIESNTAFRQTITLPDNFGTIESLQIQDGVEQDLATFTLFAPQVEGTLVKLVFEMRIEEAI
ncbi:hypothetical protein [Gehongia tenuis]|uniref:Uncharacterized protein n=1 Tax=Gehongia tenuis TaxID=2763655 RepID=A0A926D572_9FIRM|nr:hypothetical protein [Gehongia tenuis]MBC8530580.1 hypothetical protein [Gehongia tenuis]